MVIIRTSFLLLFAAVGAWIDGRTRRLPNWLTISGVATGLLYQLANGFFESGWGGAGKQVLVSLAGFLVGFGMLWMIWLARGAGAGDIKFMGAIGAWLGPRGTFVVFCLACLLAAVFVVGTLLYRGWRRVSRGSRTEDESLEPLQKHPSNLLPFGVPAGAATWCYIFYVDIFRPWLGL